MQPALMGSYLFWIMLFAAGAFAGIQSGLLGLGGMSVYVPLLLWIFHTDIAEHAQLMSAVLINSFSVVVMVGLASWFSHHRHGTIRYQQLPVMCAGALFGTSVGYMAATGSGLFASMDLLFGSYLLAIGLYSLLQKVEGVARLQPTHGSFRIGLVGGTVGGFVGFNGNSVFIPLLRNTGLNVKQAMATAQLIGLAVSATMVGLIGMDFGLQHFRSDICVALALGGFGGSYVGAWLKRTVSFAHMNAALVASCWVAGGFLLFRLGH